MGSFNFLFNICGAVGIGLKAHLLVFSAGKLNNTGSVRRQGQYDVGAQLPLSTGLASWL